LFELLGGSVGLPEGKIVEGKIVEGKIVEGKIVNGVSNDMFPLPAPVRRRL
jgi:hypothetical protein